MNAFTARVAVLLLGSTLAVACGQTGGAPTPGPTPAGGPPAGRYSCLMLGTALIGGAISIVYVPSALGTVVLGPGNAYTPLSYPQGGTYSVNAARSRITFRGGSFNGVNAEFDTLDDGTPIIRFGEGLKDPAPEVEIGESVCQRAGS
jgi:hypothetical protein